MSETQKRWKGSYCLEYHDYQYSNTHVMALLWNWLFFNPAFTPEEGREAKLQVKQIGRKAYGFFSNNDELDVNAPPHVRHDLYALDEEPSKMGLRGSVLEPKGNSRGFRIYLYDASKEKLDYIAKYNTLDDAKSALVLIAVVKE